MECVACAVVLVFGELVVFVVRAGLDKFEVMGCEGFPDEVADGDGRVVKVVFFILFGAERDECIKFGNDPLVKRFECGGSMCWLFKAGDEACDIPEFCQGFARPVNAVVAAAEVCFFEVAFDCCPQA